MFKEKLKRTKSAKPSITVSNKGCNEFKESLEITEEQKAIGVSIIDGRRCLHGLNSDQMDEMNILEMGLDAYKKLKGIKS